MSARAMTGDAGFATRLDRITQTAALIGFFGLVVMALLIFYDGAARWLWLPRISGFSDYGELVFPIVIASCFPAGLLRQTNVTVRVAGTLGGARLNAICEAFAALVTLAFFAILAWQFVDLLVKYQAAGRTTRTVDLPLAPYWVVVVAIMAACVPVQVHVAYSWIRAALTGTAPALSRLRDDELIEMERG